MPRILGPLLVCGLAGSCAGSVEVGLAFRSGQAPDGVLSRMAALLAGAGLVAPFGLLLGFVLALSGILWPTEQRRALWSRIDASMVYGLGAALPVLAALLFRLAFHFTTAYHNKALASLAWTFATLATLGAVSLLALLLGRFTRWLATRYPAVGRRDWALSLTASCWCLAAWSGFWAGPDRPHRGPFGFLGLLRKDTLDWTPLLVLVAVGVATWIFTRLTRHSSPRSLAAIAASWLVLSLTGLAVAGSSAVRPVVLNQTVFARSTLRGLHKLGDRDSDGYSRWLGGGDCDDQNPDRHPGAPERLGNGQDEDCDGEDLRAPPAAAVSSTAPAPRPTLPKDLSFLLLTVDALRWDVGYAGYPRDTTPHIDALARRSVIYERAYAISTYTGFSIPPLWASRFPSEMPRTDRHEVRYEPENTLLAERLVAAGFETRGVAGYFLFTAPLHWVDGFQQFETMVNEGTAPPGSHVDLFHTSRLTADWLIRSLQQIQDRRFFAYAHFTDPHKQYLHHAGFSKYGSTARDQYDGEVAYADHHLGRILDALEQGPAKDRTVVIITGDHGEAFGEHGRQFHGFEVWDEIVRVPLLIYVPGLAPRRVTRPVSHVDIAPTILDLAELPPDPGARGVSLVPELAGAALPPRPILIDQPRNPYYDQKRAFILTLPGGVYKFVHLIDANAYRLYDLSRDPGEQEDLVERQPELFRRVRQAYSAYVATIPDAKVTHVEP